MVSKKRTAGDGETVTSEVAAEANGAVHVNRIAALLKASRPSTEAVYVYTTESPHKICGYFEARGRHNSSGHFVGEISVYSVNKDSANPQGEEGSLIGKIVAKDHFTDIIAYPAGGHDQVSIQTAALKRPYEGVVAHDGNDNVVYDLARLMAENLDKPTEQIREWMEKFRARLPQSQVHGAADGSWTSWGHYF